MGKTTSASPAWAYPYVLKLVNATNSISAKEGVVDKGKKVKAPARQEGAKTTKRE